MTVKLMVRIEAATANDDPPCSWIATNELQLLGGKLVRWQPDTSAAAAQATFVFSSEADRDRFIAEARRIPRVSIE